MDFQYLAQAPVSDDGVNSKIKNALALFHQYKHSITKLGVQQGKGGTVIENWHIPKLELMQSVVGNI